MRTGFIDAAFAVLADEMRPMTAAEILDLAMSRGLLRSGGQTPRASMSRALYVEVRRPNTQLAKLATPGRFRVVRGSVRWALASPQIKTDP